MIYMMNMIKKLRNHSNQNNHTNHSSDIMESINALLIQQQLMQGERLVQLNTVAITQMRSLVENRNLKGLK